MLLKRSSNDLPNHLISNNQLFMILLTLLNIHIVSSIFSWRTLMSSYKVLANFLVLIDRHLWNECRIWKIVLVGRNVRLYHRFIGERMRSVALLLIHLVLSLGILVVLRVYVLMVLRIDILLVLGVDILLLIDNLFFIWKLLSNSLYFQINLLRSFFNHKVLLILDSHLIFTNPAPQLFISKSLFRLKFT